MNRTSFFDEILPSTFITKTVSGDGSRKIYKNKEQDVSFIKKVTREKLHLDGALIKYYPIDKDKTALNTANDILGDVEGIIYSAGVSMYATWTPQEYQLDLTKFGLMIPAGSDLQLYVHVDDIEQYIKRKPIAGDIIETDRDKMRYKVSDVFFGNASLWENVFCMLTLTKAAYDNNTSNLDSQTPEYASTYVGLSKTLNLDGTVETSTNASIKTTRKATIKTTAETIGPKNSLDIMTMTL